MKNNAIIPIGMALIAVEVPKGVTDSCPLCFLENINHEHICLACREQERTDGKNVIFKLVDAEELV